MTQEKQLSFWTGVRFYFLTGIAILLPIALTLFIIYFAFQFIDNLAGRYINALLYDQYGYTIPGLGFLVMLVVIFGAGFLYQHFFGNKLLPLFERLLLKVPFVANIYPSTKQLSDFLFNENKAKRFQKVVLVEYPQSGSYCVGFLTNEGIGDFNTAAKKEMVTVFMPLAPAPFSGMILIVEKSKIRETNISVDRAIKFIVSGGVVMDSSHHQQ